jgi:hypothetical protein
MKMRWSRREFLLLAATLGAPLLPWRARLGASRDVSGAPTDRARRLAGLLRHRVSARVIGAAYLELVPSEAGMAPLVDGILAGLEGGAGALQLSECELRRRLAHQVAKDFEADAAVCLKGWVVARTEARLCALAALA